MSEWVNFIARSGSPVQVHFQYCEFSYDSDGERFGELDWKDKCFSIPCLIFNTFVSLQLLQTSRYLASVPSARRQVSKIA
jgi:hypothetical protein